jgi:hypothetical protein
MFFEVISALPWNMFVVQCELPESSCFILRVELSVLCITLMIIMKTDRNIIFQNTFQISVLTLLMFEKFSNCSRLF